MTQLRIDTGYQGNDGTGDGIRDAFIKVNANFDEIYSALGNGTTISGIPYANIAGISTFAQNLQGVPNLTVGIVTTSGNLNVVGVVTSAGATIYNTTTLTSVSISGVTTFSGSGNNINQSTGTALLNNVVVSGVTTAGIAATTTLSTNSTMSFFLQNNTTLRVAVRGSDGVTRYGTISLA